ncbi:metalloregulator ArsR/SmtB family transcription factor [bacterium]|nr:metalloregulator ArsR/SmtB family transcription factor [bacterium]
MNKMTPEQNLETRAKLFKALGHPVRLLILNLIKMKPRHGEELAMILKLQQATISHHLGKLTEAGLLSSKKEQYYQTYSLVKKSLNKTLDELIHLPRKQLPARVKQDAYRDKVLNTFMKHGRITQIPAKLKKRLILLEEVVKEFEPEYEYPEREVNHILLEFNDDVAYLRRALVDHGYMKRNKGIYRRINL